MADDVLDKGGKGLTNVLKKKLGPLPVAVWVGVGGAAGYYIYRTRKAAANSAVSGNTGDGSGTVPATGSGSYSPVGSGSGSNPGSGTTDTPTRFADNQAWATAAISYLVGLGYEATQANQAIQVYLSSQPMTSAQQGMVNLAILKIGATPELVAPAQNNPPPIVTPPSGGGGGSSAPAPVTNLQAHVHSSNSISLSWTASAGATKYEATITNSGGSASITTRGTTARWDDLLPGFDSVFSVVAINGNGRSAATTVSASTPSDGSGGGGGGGSGGGIFGTWTVDPGDNLWDISKAVLSSRGLSTTNAAVLDYDKRLYAANQGVIGGNPNLIKPGQVLTLP